MRLNIFHSPAEFLNYSAIWYLSSPDETLPVTSRRKFTRFQFSAQTLTLLDGPICVALSPVIPPTPGPWIIWQKSTAWGCQHGKKVNKWAGQTFECKFRKNSFQPECRYRSQWPSPRFGFCVCQIPSSFLSCWTSLVHSEESTPPSLSMRIHSLLDFPCIG